MEEIGYASEAFNYLSHGFAGVLPVPHGRKEPVPTGFSGYKGEYPDKDQILAWMKDGFGAKVEGVFGHYSSVDANTAIRLPRNIVGIDVDSYGKKTGKETLAHAESLWGALPATVRSTSRMNNPSGIRLYRVEPGTILRTVITFPELGLDGIEICQFFHRFCMVYPSIHPDTKQRYMWVNSEGLPTADLPWAGNLPMLPEKWVDALSRPPEEDITTRADVNAVMSELDFGTPSKRVWDCLNKVRDEIHESAGGRHDECMRGIGRLLRLHHEEEPGVGNALDMLHSFFVSAVTEDGSRSSDMAESEWDRMLTGHRIHDKIASTPSRNKALEAVLGEKPVSLEAVMQARKELRQDFQEEHEHSFSPETATDQDQLPDDDIALIMGTPTVSQPGPELGDDDMALIMGWDVQPESTFNETEHDDGLDAFDRVLLGIDSPGNDVGTKTGWEHQSLDEILDATERKRDNPTIGIRQDDKRLFYAGKVNALVGPPESGKSWIAQYMAVQEINQEHSVLYLDFEDSKESVVWRLLDLGADKEAVRERFLYVAPPKGLDTDSAAALFGEISTYRPTLIVLDGLGAAMAIHNHEMKDNTEYIRFFQLLLEPMSRQGSAVVVIDHVPKNSDPSNTYAIGAQAKLQMITGAQIGVHAVRKFGRGREGVLAMYIHKDRPGGVREHSEFRKVGKDKKESEVDYWASVYVDARDQPNVRMVMRFDTQEETEAPDGEVEIRLKTDQIEEFLIVNGAESLGISTNRIIKGVPGDEQSIKNGIAEMKLRGQIEVEKGSHNANLHLLKWRSKDLAETQDEQMKLINGAPES